MGTGKAHFLEGLANLGEPHIWRFPERFWRYVPQIATVGLVGGFRDGGGIGTQEEGEEEDYHGDHDSLARRAESSKLRLPLQAPWCYRGTDNLEHLALWALQNRQLRELSCRRTSWPSSRLTPKRMA